MKIRFTWKVENPFTATKTDIFPWVGLKFRFYHPIIGNHNKEKKNNKRFSFNKITITFLSSDSDSEEKHNLN